MAAEKVIFIACAKGSTPLAQRIADGLAGSRKHPYRVLRWWTDQAFPAGEYTFERLLRMPGEVDGAVFLLTAPDEAGPGSANAHPHHNVVLEYGLFASHLGLSRCLIVGHPNAAVPTNLLGLSYKQVEPGDLARAANGVVEHFDEEFSRKPKPKVEALRVLADPGLANEQLSERPPRWLLRTCYMGAEGARAWMDLAGDPRYQSEQQRHSLHSALQKLLAPLHVRSFVSLGPGDGRLDLHVARLLARNEPLLRYVPVDICDGLLWNALRTVGQSVVTPAGFLADFEDQWHFVQRYLAAYAPPPRVYGLFGNTFGNLDQNEAHFIEGLEADLTPQDRLVLDVSLLRADAVPAAPDVSKIPPKRRAFYALGAARCAGTHPAEILADFDQRVRADLQYEPSDIPGTQVVAFRVKTDDDWVPFGYVRRYDRMQLEEWLKEAMEFDLDPAPRVVSTPGHPYDIGLFSLRPRSPGATSGDAAAPQ